MWMVLLQRKTEDDSNFHKGYNTATIAHCYGNTSMKPIWRHQNYVQNSVHPMTPPTTSPSNDMIRKQHENHLLEQAISIGSRTPRC